MCTAGNAARRNGRQEEEDEEEDLPEPATTMAPPLWPPPADVEEDEAVIEATQEDFQIGYLQISDDPSARIASEDREEEEEEEEIVNNTSLPPVNGAFIGAATYGHAGSLVGAVVSDGRNPLERIVTLNGMQFHVYGNVSGLELLGGGNPTREEDLDITDSEEEEEEVRRRAYMEKAVEEANVADAARRTAPIPLERRAMIVNAMKGINLGGFRPSWADSVPEDQWINMIRESSTSALH